VKRSSSPSDLRITDIKYCKVDLPPWGCNIIRVDTNQGISGYGELRDGASPTYLKILKSRIIGENPCNVDKIFRRIKTFGGQSRFSAGVCAIEIALWDLAGKAYGVPVYQMLGGKFRERVRRYADIHIDEGRFTGKLRDPNEVGRQLQAYIDDGYSALKILSVEFITSKEGNCSGPIDWMNELNDLQKKVGEISRNGYRAESAEINRQLYNYNSVAHPFTNLHITENGLDELEDYIANIRSVIGYKIPLAIDHFGHFPLPDMIKIARRMERFNLAWAEDMLPWYLTEQYRELKDHTCTPLATGEDQYLVDAFEPLLQTQAIDLVHPDILTSGGILETKKLGDMAMKYGASMALHMCESPVASLAGSHMALATENFFVQEFDAFDSLWWENLVEGPVHPMVEHGFSRISDAPGLGIESINEDLVREHGPVKGKTVWQNTDDFNNETSLDRIWS
jgi:L-alanine-DL-glutamate epimerase-like enolase superfamily enzyme